MGMGGEPVEKVKTLAVEAAAGADRGAAEPSTVGAATRMMSVVVKAEDNNGSSSPALADVEEELAKFAQAAASNPITTPKISPGLEGILKETASTGVPYYGWGLLKELLAARMFEAVEALEREVGFHQASGGKAYTQRRDELVASLRNFDAAPFTLQRLAELLQDPRRQYSSTHKLINGLERLLSVSSTLPTRVRKRVLRPAAPPAASSSSCVAEGLRREKLPARTEGNSGVVPNGVAPHTPNSAAATTTTSNGGGGHERGIAAGVADAGEKMAVASTVSVKVEAPTSNVVPGDDLALPAADLQTSRGRPEGIVPASDRGLEGRKRLKMEVPQEAPILSE